MWRRGKWHSANAKRKNSCSSNQDQMFNAVQWGTNSQHINSFTLCCVVLHLYILCNVHTLLILMLSLFLRFWKECCATPSHHHLLPRPKLNRQIAHNVFSTLFFRIRSGIVQPWPILTWGEKKNEWKKFRSITRKQRTTVSFGRTNENDAKIHKINRVDLKKMEWMPERSRISYSKRARRYIPALCLQIVYYFACGPDREVRERERERKMERERGGGKEREGDR